MADCRLTTYEVTAARRAFASAASGRPDAAGIVAFQSRLGVKPDGDPGSKTLGALEEAAALAYGLRLDRKTLRLPASQFFPGTYDKDLVVLHHTAGGSAASSLAGWIATKERVGTAYLVERDGTVFEVMPPEAAAGNLGLGGRQETRSVGIELCNWGWLKKVGAGPGTVQAWRAWPRTKAGQPTVTIPDAAVVQDRWRGEQAWERYPEAQVAASVALTRYLVDRFGIDADVAPGIWDHDEADLERFKRFRGVVSHGHVRRDKTDVSPAYPWERLRQAVEGR